MKYFTFNSQANRLVHLLRETVKNRLKKLYAHLLLIYVRLKNIVLQYIPIMKLLLMRYIFLQKFMRQQFS